MDWDLLRYFRAVAIHRGFSAAAKDTGASIATVSRKVRDLELALGAPLLVRNGRGYRLSEFGIDVASRLKAPTDALGDILSALQSQGQKRVRTVTLNSVESLASFWLPEQIDALCEGEDQLNLEIRSDFSLVDPRSREADIVLRLGQRGSDPLVGRAVGLAAYGLFKAPGQDRMVQYIGPMGDTPVSRWAKSTFDGWQKPGIACESITSAVNILASVGGSAVLPAFIARKHGWLLVEPGQILYTDVMLLRSPSIGRNDPPVRIYRRLLDRLKAYDFLAPIEPPGLRSRRRASSNMVRSTPAVKRGGG